MNNHAESEYLLVIASTEILIFSVKQYKQYNNIIILIDYQMISNDKSSQLKHNIFIEQFYLFTASKIIKFLHICAF